MESQILAGVRVVQTVASLRRAIAEARQSRLDGQQPVTVGFVPTMGALHQGHLSLVRKCLQECSVGIVSVFVNPTQFGPEEDYTSYPRTLAADCRLLAPLGIQAVFAPPVEEVYPPGDATTVSVSGITEAFEGAIRPGHFSGVATVVLKLLEMVRPDRAYFGQKDYQQAVMIRRMVSDLHVPVEIRVCPIVRESDGLALSSRNVYLSAQERQQALVLWRSLQAAEGLVAQGMQDCDQILAAMRQVFAEEPAVCLNYATLVDPQTLTPVKTIQSQAVALVAAQVGRTRLIDNALLEVPDSSTAPSHNQPTNSPNQVPKTA